jgi:predicted GIY-YIG superfamily endonuclease
VNAFHVYICFDANRRPLYVGQTNNVKRRMKEHTMYAGWGRTVALMTVLTYETRQDAETVERRYINKLRPDHNSRHNPRCQSVAEAIENHALSREWYRRNGWAPDADDDAQSYQLAS